MSFGKLLKEWMFRLEFNQAELARVTGISTSTISRYMSQERKPSGRTVERIMTFFKLKYGVSEEEFWSLADDGYGHETEAYEDTMFALDMAIDLMKQEPKADILNEIKTELLDNAEMHEDGDYYIRDKWVSEIIDKYREQEPKPGRWINGHCSECGCDVPTYIVDWRWIKDMDAKYCPNCGAKMQGKEQTWEI